MFHLLKIQFESLNDACEVLLLRMYSIDRNSGKQYTCIAFLSKEIVRIRRKLRDDVNYRKSSTDIYTWWDHCHSITVTQTFSAPYRAEGWILIGFIHVFFWSRWSFIFKGLANHMNFFRFTHTWSSLDKLGGGVLPLSQSLFFQSSKWWPFF